MKFLAAGLALLMLICLLATPSPARAVPTEAEPAPAAEVRLERTGRVEPIAAELWVIPEIGRRL